MLKPLTLATMLLGAMPALYAAPLSAPAIAAARHAADTYPNQLTASLAMMVSFNTVADPAVAALKNPQHIGFKQFLKEEAERLGLDYHDHGMVVVIGLGASDERLGIITHGDVQPVNPAKWAKSPFQLDATSEPGRLLARGAEDDKGPIATALYAMKAIQDQQVPLRRRLELYVYMAEESDWEPLEAFLKEHQPPQLNITLDAEYPVVTAEKGWGSVAVTIPAVAAGSADNVARTEKTEKAEKAGSARKSGKAGKAGKNGKGSKAQAEQQPGQMAHAAKRGSEPVIQAFSGGYFASQIPEDASAVIGNATRALEAEIRKRGAAHKGMRYQMSWQGNELKVTALGLSAHSSKPEEGVNAIAMLADALKVRQWRASPAGAMVDFINDMVGTGIYGERFGKVAYRDGFMGPMTVAPTVLAQKGNAMELTINLRRPRGKGKAELTAQFQQAFDQWKRLHAPQARIQMEIGEPWVQTDAPQVPVLLDVFGHYTGVANARPVAIGGGTNSRLFPKAVAFGPAMPGVAYTGHSEHEFITQQQLLLNLQMYTAALVELAR